MHSNNYGTDWMLCCSKVGQIDTGWPNLYTPRFVLPFTRLSIRPPPHVIQTKNLVSLLLWRTFSPLRVHFGRLFSYLCFQKSLSLLYWPWSMKQTSNVLLCVKHMHNRWTCKWTCLFEWRAFPIQFNSVESLTKHWSEDNSVPEKRSSSKIEALRGPTLSWHHLQVLRIVL